MIKHQRQWNDDIMRNIYSRIISSGLKAVCRYVTFTRGAQAAQNKCVAAPDSAALAVKESVSPLIKANPRAASDIKAARVRPER